MKEDAGTVNNITVTMPGAVVLIIAALLGSAGSEKPEDSISTGNTIIKKENIIIDSLLQVLIIRKLI